MSAEHLFVKANWREENSHRIQSSLVTDGHNSVLLHNLYMPVSDVNGDGEKIWDDLQKRLAERPLTSHIVAGDFQGICLTWLGVGLSAIRAGVFSPSG